jgi:hypothetical protein
MKTSIAILATLALAAAGAHHATADCTITYPSSVMQYWPNASTPVISSDNPRCDWDGVHLGCHLSGWLFKPTSTGAGRLPAVIYVGASVRNQSRHDVCEIVNRLVGKGYVVFVPYLRGIDDVTPNTTGAGFHNTGKYIDDYVDDYIADHGQPNTQVGHQIIAGMYLQYEAYDLDEAMTKLLSLSTGTAPLVAPGRIAIMGNGDAGALAIFASNPSFQHTAAAILDLSGLGTWWDIAPAQWQAMIGANLGQRTAPIYIQESANESPDGSYTPAVTSFYLADDDEAFEAKLALYAPFGISSAMQATCDSHGYGPARCAQFLFVSDGPQVGRWMDTAVAFMRRYGI